MEDRKASLLAVGVGGLAIGGFWMARPTGPHSKLRVIEQQNLSAPLAGLDDDAATMFRVRVPLERQGFFNDAVIYRVIDRKGNLYPLLPMVTAGHVGAFKLPRGYPEPIDEPKLQALYEGEVIATAPIADLPEPVKEPLVTKENDLLALVYHDGWLEVRPKFRIPENERWQIRAVRTPFTTVRDVNAVLPNRMTRRPSSWLRIPYEGRSEAVEVELLRYRLIESSDTVTLSGFELQKRFDSTALMVRQSRFVPSKLGLVVRVPRQYTGPYRPGRHADPRVASASVSLDFGPLAPKADDPLPDRSGSLEILSPQPSELGLRELRIGPGILRGELSDEVPLREGPFAVKVRVKSYRPQLVSEVHATLPITKARSRASVWDRFGLGRDGPVQVLPGH